MSTAQSQRQRDEPVAEPRGAKSRCPASLRQITLRVTWIFVLEMTFLVGLMTYLWEDHSQAPRSRWR